MATGTEKTAVIIPAYKVKEHIISVIQAIPGHIGHIIVVDDNCPQGSGKEAEKTGRPNLIVLYHRENQGVGGAVITGYRKALELGCDVMVKMDGDGQMDPAYLDDLIRPLAKDTADYTKGNRFRNFRELRHMPWLRFFGNSALSFVLKLASGYWNIMDPTNGYTAIHRRILERMNMEKVAKGYFFESDMLIRLNAIGAVVKEVEMPARYEDEKSSMRISRVLLQFPPKLLKGFAKRILLKYFIYDFNMASVYILFGLPFFLFGVIFGAIEWVDSYRSGTPRTAGTIMLVALPIILGFQMLLQAVNIDINSIPKKEK